VNAPLPPGLVAALEALPESLRLTCFGSRRTA
jgi:hypothetical protein